MCVAVSAGHSDRHFCASAFFLFLVKGDAALFRKMDFAPVDGCETIVSIRILPRRSTRLLEQAIRTFDVCLRAGYRE